MKIRDRHIFACAFLLSFLVGRTVVTAVSQTQDQRHLVNFYNKYSQWGRLDWTGDRVTYVGDMPEEGAALAFFNSLYAGFSCLDGSIVPAGPKDGHHASSERPLGKLSFFSVDGTHRVVVQLETKKLEYRGDFPIDGRGRAFFGFLWQSYQACFTGRVLSRSSPR